MELNQASLNSDVVTGLLHLGPGYVVRKAGSVLEITQCTEVEVAVRESGTCHADLAVYFRWV